MCITTKKCKACKQTITIDIDNIHDIAMLQGNYYHTSCILQLADKRVKAQKHAAYWDTVHEDIDTLQKNATDAIRTSVGRDHLQDHILNHYDIVTLPTNFWPMVTSLYYKGKYKQNKCKPVDTEIVFRTWKHFQRYLDQVATNNRSKNKGPKTDIDRIPYDLAIVINKIPEYHKEIAKIKAADAEREAMAKEKTKINYNNIIRSSKVENDGIGDISDFLDDLF